MGDDRGIAGATGGVDGLQGLGQCADLVDLDQDAVGRAGFDPPPETDHVGDEEVVPNQLLGFSQPAGQPPPAFPVVLGQPVLDGYQRVTASPTLPDVDQSLGIESPALALQLVPTLTVELAGSRVDGDEDLITGAVTASLDRLHQQADGVLVCLELGSEASLVALPGAKPARMEDFLEGMKYLGSPSESLPVGGSSRGRHHEFLEVDPSLGVATAVEDVHQGDRKNYLGLGQECAVEWLVLRRRGCAGAGEGGAQNGVRTQLRLVGGAVEGDQSLVDSSLVGDVRARERVGDRAADIGHRGEHALSLVAGAIAVAQLDSFVGSGRSSRGDRRASALAGVEHDIHLNRRVAARIQDLARGDLSNRWHARVSDYSRSSSCRSPPGVCPSGPPSPISSTTCSKSSPSSSSPICWPILRAQRAMLLGSFSSTSAMSALPARFSMRVSSDRTWAVREISRVICRPPQPGQAGDASTAAKLRKKMDCRLRQSGHRYS